MSVIDAQCIDTSLLSWWHQPPLLEGCLSKRRKTALPNAPLLCPTTGHWLLACVSAGELLQAEVGSPVMFSLPPGAGAKAKDESFLEVSCWISQTLSYQLNLQS
jgi:hypothetical protein